MTKCIITAFSYRHDEKFRFYPSHLITDIRRMISFCLYKTGILPENITLITDCSCDKEQAKRYNLEYQTKAIKHLNRIKKDAEIDLRMKTGKWLKQYDLDMIYELTDRNILEYCYLFVNYIFISGKEDYIEKLKIYSENTSELLLYFSCHGIKSQNKTYLAIPCQDCIASELISSTQFREKLSEMCKNKNTVVFFDACYSEKFCPKENNILFIGSTHKNETCGFYSLHDKIAGSLFTHYLIRVLREVKRDEKCSLEILNKIRDDILTYRRGKYKTDQNIYIWSTEKEFPNWLFTNELSLTWS